MLKQVLGWINQRWPFSKLLYYSLDEPIVGGASFAYTLGSATLLAFVIQIVSGIWQLFYYVPTVDHAYDSLSYLRTEIPFGWLIHGFHYWGATLMIILAVLHMTRVFVYGAYKPPRELVWLTGVGLLMIVMGLSFTGAPLPWDERGYWAAEVGTSIAGTVPFIGEFCKRILRGGDVMGQLALSRMFVIHVAILPGLLMALLGIHLMAFRQFGSVGPWEKEKRRTLGPFWPNQVVKDLIVAGVTLLLLVWLSAFVPPPLAGPADPTDSSYIPKPEWNFLFLYEALKLLPGKWEILGTVGIPLIGLATLVLLPFIDRSPERNPRKRPKAMLTGALAAIFVIALTIVGLRPIRQQTASQPREIAAGSPATLSKTARAGQNLFKSLGCIGCHAINGTGGRVGPDLATTSLANRSRAWLIIQIHDPKANDPKTIMPAFNTLSTTETNDLVDYVLSVNNAVSGTSIPPKAASPSPDSPSSPSESASASPSPQATPGVNAGVSAPSGTPPVTASGPPGQAAQILGNIDLGKLIFAKNCAACHGSEGQGGITNPGSKLGKVPALNPINPSFIDKDPEIFADNLDRYIQHGSMPEGAHPALHMPAFGATNALTQQEIANIEAYIMRLNGHKRGAIQHAGVDPEKFFYLVLIAFAAMAGLLLALGSLRPAAPKNLLSTPVPESIEEVKSASKDDNLN